MAASSNSSDPFKGLTHGEAYKALGGSDILNMVGKMTSALEGFSQADMDSIIKELKSDPEIKKVVLCMTLIMNSSRKVEGFDRVIRYLGERPAFAGKANLGMRQGVADGYNATAIRTTSVALIHALVNQSDLSDKVKSMMAAAVSKWEGTNTGDAPKIRMETKAKYTFNNSTIEKAAKDIAKKL